MPGPLSDVTVSVQALRLLAAAAAHRGVAPAEVLAAHGVDLAILSELDARVPAQTVLALWAELPERLALPDFGLWLAELAVGADTGSLGEHLVKSAPTLGEGLCRLIAFERVLHGVSATSLTLEGDVAQIRHQPPFGAGPGTIPALEFAFAWLVGVARRNTGVAIVPRSVSFAHPSSAPSARYESVFGVAPAFGATVSLLELHARDLSLPQRTADELVARLVERHARALLSQIPSGDGLASRARAWIAERLARGELETASVAALSSAIGVSARSLQRRLAAEGTSYQALLDDVRHALSLEYLTQPELSVAEIAFALGFAEESAFHRAFFRWAGITPGEQRRKLRRP